MRVGFVGFWGVGGGPESPLSSSPSDSPPGGDSRPLPLPLGLGCSVMSPPVARPRAGVEVQLLEVPHGELLGPNLPALLTAVAGVVLVLGQATGSGDSGASWVGFPGG